ncbi:putative alpha/Beta hydrolase [Helianthus annuus]|nr:putative alpha/Beta hydrolase [Helianthus annuus]
MNCSLKIQFVCSPTYFCFYVKLGVGGFKFSMGAATALYSASCFTHRKFGNGNAYSTHLDAVVGLSGWLPCAKDPSKKFEGEEAANRASSLPILLCHGKGKHFLCSSILFLFMPINRNINQHDIGSV